MQTLASWLHLGGSRFNNKAPLQTIGVGLYCWSNFTPPTAPDKCAPFGFFKHLLQNAAVGAELVFTLQHDSPVRAGAGLVDRSFSVLLDDNGEIGTRASVLDEDGEVIEPGNIIELDRSDMMEPAGISWHVKCEAAGLDHDILLNAATFDLNSITGQAAS